MKKRIINTGQHLPKAGIGDHFELIQNRKRLVEQPILKQSRKDGTVLYGRYAVNKILGPGYHRATYDFDVYSGMPKRHALQIERSIDRGTNSDLAFVEQTHYPDPQSKREKRLFRVRTRFSERTEVDYNTMPRDVRFVKRGGVRYETIGRAKNKYKGMIRRGEVNRMPKAQWDLSDIQTQQLIKKGRRRLRRL